MQCSIKDGEKGVSHTDIWLLIKSAKFYVILFRFKRNENILLLYTGYRGEICRDRHDWRSCKICAGCVNFLENKAISRIICVEQRALHTPSVIMHCNC